MMFSRAGSTFQGEASTELIFTCIFFSSNHVKVASKETDKILAIFDPPYKYVYNPMMFVTGNLFWRDICLFVLNCI